MCCSGWSCASKRWSASVASIPRQVLIQAPFNRCLIGQQQRSHLSIRFPHPEGHSAREANIRAFVHRTNIGDRLNRDQYAFGVMSARGQLYKTTHRKCLTRNHPSAIPIASMSTPITKPPIAHFHSEGGGSRNNLIRARIDITHQPFPVFFSRLVWRPHASLSMASVPFAVIASTFARKRLRTCHMVVIALHATTGSVPSACESGGSMSSATRRAAGNGYRFSVDSKQTRVH